MARREVLRLALTPWAVAAALGWAAGAAAAAAPGLGSPWTGAGSGAVTVVSDGSTSDPELRYLARRTFTGSWSFHTTAAADRTLAIRYDYAPAHTDLLVTVRMASFVTHDGATRATQLVSDDALLCCLSAPRRFRGTAVFELAAGHAYGFRMSGSNLDLGQLKGTLRLALDDQAVSQDPEPVAHGGGSPPVTPTRSQGEDEPRAAAGADPPASRPAPRNTASAIPSMPVSRPPPAAPATTPGAKPAVTRPARRPIRPDSRVTPRERPGGSSPRPTAPRPDPDALVNRNPHRSDVVALLRRPDNLPLGADDIGRSIGITGLLLLLLGLPARLFSKTVQRNRDEIAGWFAPVRTLVERMTPRGARRLLAIAATSALTGAATLSLLDPTFPQKSFPAAFALGMLVASSVIVMIQALTWRRYIERRAPELSGGWTVYPGQVAVSAICVAVSRIGHFAPGLMFGMHGDYEPRGRMSLEHAGRRIALTFGALLLIGLVAWVASIPLAHAAARRDAGFVTLALDAGVAGIACAGVQTIAFGLVPLVFLDGHVMCRWRPGWWFALWSLGLAWLALVVINPAIWHQPQYPIATGWLAGLLAFQAVVAIGLWSFFAARGSAVSPGQVGA